MHITITTHAVMQKSMSRQGYRCEESITIHDTDFQECRRRTRSSKRDIIFALWFTLGCRHAFAQFTQKRRRALFLAPAIFSHEVAAGFHFTTTISTKPPSISRRRLMTRHEGPRREVSAIALGRFQDAATSIILSLYYTSISASFQCVMIDQHAFRTSRPRSPAPGPRHTSRYRLRCHQ